ncbi:MAG: 5-formyltetrahydrofolate cyclo-ligase [Cyclobacteriaceae bacterium]
MNSISKSTLRRVLLDYRRLLDPRFFEERNELLCEKILAFIKQKEARTIHVFLAIKKNKEPDLTMIFQNLRKAGCEIVVSKTDFIRKTQEHFYLKEDTILRENKMRIPEPVNAESANFENVDLIIVPLSAADKHRNRIGYGGGYYDRLLESSNAVKVGLCLSPLLDEISQTEKWDVELDQILTPF